MPFDQEDEDQVQNQNLEEQLIFIGDQEEDQENGGINISTQSDN